MVVEFPSEHLELMGVAVPDRYLRQARRTKHASAAIKVGRAHGFDSVADPLLRWAWRQDNRRGVTTIGCGDEWYRRCSMNT